MWICDNCETQNNEQDRFCVLCAKERQGEPSVAENKENHSTVVPGMEQQSATEQPVEPAAMTEEDDWEDAPEAGAAATAWMHAERPLAKSGVAVKGDLTPEEESHEEPLKTEPESARKISITIMVILAIVALLALGIYMNNKYRQFNEAIEYYEMGTKEDLQVALVMMKDLNGLFSSANWESRIEREIELWDRYEEAEEAWKKASANNNLGALQAARDLYADLKDFKDSEEKVREIETRIGHVEKAKKIDDAIDKIEPSEVELTDESVIIDLRKQYDNAPSEVKRYVKQLWLLEHAEDIIAKAKDNVTRVEDRIDAIDLGNITVRSKDVINAAWNSYNDLGEYKQYVSDDRVYCLERAREAYKQCCLNEGMRLLRGMWEKENEGNMFYHPDSFPKYVNERTFVLPYIGMNSSNSIWIRVRFNYFGKRNIEFAKIRVNCDGSTRSFDVSEYSYVSHPYNGYVKVEDFTADSSTRSFLNRIACSSVTTVQFIDSSGDVTAEYTISEKDKREFQEELDAYSYLIESGEYYEG